MQDEIKTIVGPLLAACDRELADSYAAVLYGSAARGEFVSGVSDINLLLVCDSLKPEVLRRLSASLESLQQQGQPPPLLAERGEWGRAVDVFPIEVTDMQIAHETLRGSDPVAPMHVDPRDLRRSLEHELRAKLLRLRQSYALHSADEAALAFVAGRSVASIATLFRVSLPLFGNPAPLPTPDCLAAAGAALGISAAPVIELWHSKRTQVAKCSAELFEGYVAAVASAVRVVDQFTPGGT